MVDLWWSGGFQAQNIITSHSFLAFRPSLCRTETLAQCIPSEQPSAKGSAKHKGRGEVKAAETLGNSADSLPPVKALVRLLAFGEEKPSSQTPTKKKGGEGEKKKGRVRV